MSERGLVALVTGGGQGIGRNVAEHLLNAGWKVALCDLPGSGGPATERELQQKYPGNVKFLVCDVTNPVQFEGAFKSTIEIFGKINLVVNNAGVLKEENWDKMIDINVYGVTKGTKLAFKYMSKESGGDGGTIVNISSILAIKTVQWYPVYSATKTFVFKLGQCYGSKLFYDRYGVKVLTIMPAATDTALSNECSPTGDLHLGVEEKEEIKNQLIIQEKDNVGRGILEVLTKGENGSSWLIQCNEPPKRVQMVHEVV